MAASQPGVEVRGPAVAGSAEVLSAAALDFLTALERRFRDERARLLERRDVRATEIRAGATLDFLPSTAAIRADRAWRVAETPPDLLDRRVEITGPAEPKMMINALNSGAKVFMADLEDALSPTWANVVGGQAALRDAVRGTLAFTSPEGKAYRVGDRPAVLLVRPRGWHLEERHLLVDGAPMSASLFDAGLYLFHNAAERMARGTGPYFYLPKLQSHLEARLWNDVFLWAQDALGIRRGSVRATVLIETIHAAFEMDEILWELREHAAGLNAGRWDYLFSCIKTFGARPPAVLPDRAQLTMTVPFMRAYTELLVATCHRRGAHAIGGMAAFIPSRRDAAVNATAMARVREDKERESRDGFDGTWVAHPDLVPLATEVFDGVLGAALHQKDRLRDDVAVTAAQLRDVRVEGGRITEAGVRLNVSVALQYLDAWLSGNGAAAINNLMEDAATAEISRSQVWQWRVTGAPLDDGRPLTAARYRAIRDEELATIRGSGATAGRLDDAVAVVDALVLADEFEPFLTPRAYGLLP
ncbi:MAG TPA: malate synthase A [Candidatus Sulfomarinibacteraceae bacterium]|nr:malate synthase A [Candidatus Sulfomarinibacteraceae bacterium]